METRPQRKKVRKNKTREDAKISHFEALRAFYSGSQFTLKLQLHLLLTPHLLSSFKPPPPSDLAWGISSIDLDTSY